VAAGRKDTAQIVRLLLSHGAEVDLKDSQGRTALEYAREKKSMLAVQEFETDSKSRSVRSEQQSSPYAPFNNDQNGIVDGLPKPLFHQCMLMVREGIIRREDIHENAGMLLSMGLTRGLVQLKSYIDSVRSGKERRPLAAALSSGANVRQEGIWQGLRDGKPFGFVKARGESFYTHRSQVRDADSLEKGQQVFFEIGFRNDRPEAQNVCAVSQAGNLDQSMDIVWVTNGSIEPTVAPILMLMTREEATVMTEFGAQVQVHDNPYQPFVDKHFRIPSPIGGLPDASLIFSKAAYPKAHASELEAKNLGDTKSLLDEKDIVVWKQHTSKTLITGDVVKTLRKDMDPEMCTKAFAKMYEMLCAYDLVAPSRDTPKYHTLHLCEAPGAFICATNHYIQSRFPRLEWKWRACSLNPYFEGNNTDAMVDDDKFINETAGNWYFGEDDTGDMRLRENIEGAIAAAKAMDGPLLLVTADGSVDCSDVPNEQEEFTAQLHYCETVAALGALDVGGCFVLKMFMLFEHSSIGLIYLLSCLFQDVSVCKPVMSTPGNSETYIISRGFLGISKEYLDVLLANTGKEWPTDEMGEKKALISLDSMAQEWMDKMVECGIYFSRLQGSVIKRNLRLFDEFTRQEGQAVSQARTLISHEWMKRYQIRRIDRSQRIVSGKILHGNSNRLGAEGRKRDAGSLAERIDLKEKRKRIREGENAEDPLNEGLQVMKKMKVNDGSASHALPNEAEQNEPVISDFARKQMDKMGFKTGEGLGKSGQGILTPIQATVKLDFRAGISYSGSCEINSSGIAALEPSDLVWIDRRIIQAIIGDGKVGDSSCIKEGKRLVEYQMSKFCAQNIVLELLDERDHLTKAFTSLSADEVQSQSTSERSGLGFKSSEHDANGLKHKQILERLFGCYKVGNAGFVSRAAVKLADINRLCLDFFAESRDGEAGFIDLHGGRGGFSDFALWKLGNLAGKSWILNRKHKLSPDLRRFKSASLLDASPTVLEIFGSESSVDGSCLSELEPLITSAKESKILYVFGDGVVKPIPANVRSKESISIKTFLCQCIVALDTLAVGGYFICKITDMMGRCTIGAVLILATVFDRITCLKPEMSCPAKSERFLVCTGFVGKESSADSVAHLREVMHRAEQLDQDSTKDIVAFVQQKYLMESAFSSALIKMNERDSKQEILYAKYVVSVLPSDSAGVEANLDVGEFLDRLGLSSI
jgi:cap2 methyltransferase